MTQDATDHTRPLGRRHALPGAGAGAALGIGVCGIPLLASRDDAAPAAASASAPGAESGDGGSPTPTPYDPVRLTGEIGDAQLAIYTLGTGAGQTFNPGRSGMCTLLKVEDVFYLVDVGWGAARRLQQAVVDPLTIRAGFVTHQHSDHLADLWNIFWGALHTAQPPQPILIHGPGPAGLPSDPVQPLPVTEGVPPRPGMAAVVRGLQDAYAAENNNVAAEFTTATAYADAVRGVDIEIPATAGASPDETAPVMDPFEVYRDELVTVTAVLVPHGGAYPSFAYRFDTPHGSVAFSGDTAVHENVVRIARDADVLVHEAIDADYYAAHGADEAAVKHFKEAHTTPQDVGRQATAAGARSVLLSHLGPGSSEQVSDESWRSRVKEQYDGPAVVGHDLRRMPVVAGRGVAEA